MGSFDEIRLLLDPADRFLAATALVYNLTLVTADSRLLSSKQFSVLPGIVINESPKKIATDQTSHEGTTRQAHTDSHGQKGLKQLSVL